MPLDHQTALAEIDSLINQVDLIPVWNILEYGHKLNLYGEIQRLQNELLKILLPIGTLEKEDQEMIDALEADIDVHKSIPTPTLFEKYDELTRIKWRILKIVIEENREDC